MVLVDTSSWIHFLREGGDKAVDARVRELLASGSARLCSMVMLELWNSMAAGKQQKQLRLIEATVPFLGIDAAVWEQSMAYAQQARKNGLTLPHADLLIAACATRYSVEVETADSDFERLLAVIQ